MNSSQKFKTLSPLSLFSNGILLSLALFGVLLFVINTYHIPVGLPPLLRCV